MIQQIDYVKIEISAIKTKKGNRTVSEFLLVYRLLFQEGYVWSIDRMRMGGNDEDNTVIGMFHFFPDKYCHSNLQKENVRLKT